MAEKQAQLNGAYYGPAIPPPQSYHRPGRSGCGCGCCLLSCLLKIIITIAVVLGLAVLIFWLVVRPNKVKFHVTEANLSEFNINNNTLHYNLALNITVRNPNKKIGIYYDRIEARGKYEDQRFGSQFLTPFYQGHKNTSILTPAFQGQQLMLLSGDELTDFNEERVSGVYSIDVTLYLKIRFKIGDLKIGKFKPKIQCELKVPSNSSAVPFQRTECDWDY
ncbi:NDR1/HIN1-like protein 3 [Ricinus communis]|uniref:Syntaxin, plant, putative n=1 Tax=Ricinus communis TaxID=3988 RepID=B9T2S1_RICCO|nr:NDR1/HIN1-like protein 3 [Ricinus communis]EEF29834.1 syntaxin, plant, putative [Ricinus communis]|eukprot:XP_002532540.1 NDR1/HIN1-like protein 3 [Ricinus communis]